MVSFDDLHTTRLSFYVIYSKYLLYHQHMLFVTFSTAVVTFISFRSSDRCCKDAPKRIDKRL